MAHLTNSVFAVFLFIFQLRCGNSQRLSTTPPPELSIGSLMCYDCSETLISKGKPYNRNSTCRYLYGVKGRFCLADQSFCLAEYVRLYNTIKTFVRKCAAKCSQGCVTNSWWLTNVKCTQCCKTNFCNTNKGNSVPGGSAGVVAMTRNFPNLAAIVSLSLSCRWWWDGRRCCYHSKCIFSFPSLSWVSA